GMSGECAAPSYPNHSSDLLRAHVFAADTGHHRRLLHRVAAERLAELLIENHLDEGRHALLLSLAGRAQRLGQLGLRLYCHAFQSATFRDLCIAEMRIELVSLIEIPKAPSPAKPTQGISGLPILAPMITGKP